MAENAWLDRFKYREGDHKSTKGYVLGKDGNIHFGDIPVGGGGGYGTAGGSSVYMPEDGPRYPNDPVDPPADDGGEEEEEEGGGPLSAEAAPQAAPASVGGIQQIAQGNNWVNMPMPGSLRQLGNRILPRDSSLLAGMRRVY